MTWDRTGARPGSQRDHAGRLGAPSSLATTTPCERWPSSCRNSTPRWNGDYEDGIVLRPAVFLDADSRRRAEGERRRLRAAGSAGAYIEATLACRRRCTARCGRHVWWKAAKWSRRAYMLLH